MPGADQDVVTLGELRRTVDNLALQLSTARAEMGGLASIPAQLDSMTKLWAAQLETERQRTAAAVQQLTSRVDGLEDDVKDLTGWKTWTFRLVLGAVCLALLALVLPGDTSR